MVSVAYTVVKPGTVMIKTLYTTTTYHTVPRLLILNKLTLSAKIIWIKNLNNSGKI